MKKIELLSICTVQDFWVTQRQTKYFPLNQTFACKDNFVTLDLKNLFDQLIDICYSDRSSYVMGCTVK
jgi:hypothetical protein